MKRFGLCLIYLCLLSACQHTEPEMANPACQEQPDAGMCRAAFTKYYFNQQTQKCQTFTWGGCGGNVPFDTLNACQETCGTVSKNKSEALSDQAQHLHARLMHSWLQWRKVKDAKGKSFIYHYTQTWSSWVGFGYETRLHVENNQVTERHYRAWDNTQKTQTSWTETGKALGSHEDGAVLSTLDDLYVQCQQWLNRYANDKNYQVTLTVFKGSSLLKSCSYRPVMCADDCSTGFTIKALNVSGE